MPKAFVSTVINAPLERVWRVVSDFNGLPAWMPGMKDSVIEPGKKDTEIGAVRKLSMAGTKDVLRERLEALSPDEFLITYSVLEGPLPVKNIRTSIAACARSPTSTARSANGRRNSKLKRARKKKASNSWRASSTPASVRSSDIWASDSRAT